MTKTYELPNEKIIMADVDEKHHTATVSVYALDDLVEAVNKTGHWIEHPKGIYAHLVCDKCLSNAPYDCRTNYCPNCGARMDEPQSRK